MKFQVGDRVKYVSEHSDAYDFGDFVDGACGEVVSVGRVLKDRYPYEVNFAPGETYVCAEDELELVK